LGLERAARARPSSSRSVAATASMEVEGGAEVPAELAGRAGRAICEADFLLIAGGAGMSADSGLATFGTMTAKMGSALGGLTYDQAAGSNTMFKDPELFYGFWAMCTRSYEQAEPHEGYGILRDWAARVEARAARRHAVPGGPERRAFALTTNVDGFFKRSGVVAPEALGEVHGSLARWQCGGVPSGQRFPLVQRGRCGDALFDAPPLEGADFVACRYRGPPPRCPNCGSGWARPHIFLFGDGDRFVDDQEALGMAAYGRWREAVLAALRADPGLRLAVVEVGCGLRVPSLRKRCEEVLAASPAGQCELIRINPEFESHGLVAAPTLSLKATGLTALRQVHREVLAAGTPQDVAAPPGGQEVGAPVERPLAISPASAFEVRRVLVEGLGDRRLRIVCLSDTHSLHASIPAAAVPPGDVLIHCGDFTKKGKEAEVRAFHAFMAGLPHATKLVVAGNHDVGPFCEFEAKHAARLLPSVTYLDNALVSVEGLRFYGSPWDRRGNRALPPDVDVLVTHDPPQGILDAGHGCEYLRRDVASKSPRVHVFGHIHEACGVVAPGEGGDDVPLTTFVNAAMANNGMISRSLDKPITLIEVVP